MKRSELYIEHHYRGRFLKALRFESGCGPVFIGSARQSDVRLLGQDVAGIHAVIESHGPNWQMSDLGSVTGTWVANGSGEAHVTEHHIEGETEVRIGDHELKFSVREPRRALFEQTVSSSGTHQRIVIKYKGKTINTYLLERHQGFDGIVNGEKLVLPPLSGDVSLTKAFGDIGVIRTFASAPEVIDPEPQRVSSQLKFKVAAIALFLFIAVPVTMVIPKPPEDKPDLNQFTKIIYDAKVLQTRRTRAMSLNKKTTGNQGVQQIKEIRPQDLGVSTKVISKIKASGLTQLIGKIAKRAGKSSNWTMTTSNDSNPVSDHKFNTVGGSGTVVSGKPSQGFKIKGVGTNGVAGGGQYKEGSSLAGGRTGNAEVGVVEEETLVDGGLDREVIAAIIREHLGEIRYCYERQLSGHPELYGKVAVKFVIGAVGEVTSQQIGASSLKNANVEGCILRRIARIKFPAPKGGTSVIVTYPFLFKSLN